MAHQTGRLTEKTREAMKDPNSRAETIYQSPILIAIFFEGFLSFLK